jgi:hypothetical protein
MKFHSPIFYLDEIDETQLEERERERDPWILFYTRFKPNLVVKSSKLSLSLSLSLSLYIYIYIYQDKMIQQQPHMG